MQLKKKWNVTALENFALLVATKSGCRPLKCRLMMQGLMQVNAFDAALVVDAFDAALVL